MLPGINYSISYTLGLKVTISLSTFDSLSDLTTYSIKGRILSKTRPTELAQKVETDPNDPLLQKTTKFNLVEHSTNIDISYFKPDGSISEAEIESAVKNGKALSGVTSATSSVSDTLAVLGVILAADQSGATLKFSQVSKLISRLRYLNINYGSVFGNFLDGLGNSFDKDTSSTLSQEIGEDTSSSKKLATIEKYKLKRAFLEKFSAGDKGKFNVYTVDMFLLGKSNTKWMEKLMEEDE